MSENRDFPMTGIENAIKTRFFDHHVGAKQIFTPIEFASYITSMIREDGGKTTFEGEDDKTLALLQNPTLKPAVENVARGPESEESAMALADSFLSQKEQSQMLEDFDISCWRMLRYIPAHWHSNEYFELYYAYMGTCPIYFEKEVVDLHAGSILILAPGIVHATPCYADDAVLFVYHIRSSTFDRVFWNQLRQGGLMEHFFREALKHQKNAAYLHFETQVDPDIEALLSRITTEYHTPISYTSQMLNALMSEFFVLLLRRYEGTVRLPRTANFYWRHEYSAILTYIEQHYHDKKLEDIAAKFGYSRRQITRIIEQATGGNYARLIIRLRMERAAFLLKRGITPENTAELVGYQNLSSFYRAFSTYHGCTPKQYVNR